MTASAAIGWRWCVPALVIAALSTSLTESAQAQIPQASGPVRQVVSNSFCYVVRDDGSVVGWGQEEEGLGGARTVPAGGVTMTPFVLTLPGKVQQMAAGAVTTYALMQDGSLWAWGRNAEGQFGRGPGSRRTPDNPMESATPLKLDVPGDIVRISAASRYALAVRRDGSVLVWGDTPWERPSAALAPLAGVPPVVDVAAAGSHALLLARDGTVYGIGDNKDAQLGLDPMVTRRTATPVKVPGIDRVTAVGAWGTSNFGYSGALRQDGTVWMWGSDQSATMGDGSFWGDNGSSDPTPVPTMVKGITTAKMLSLGAGHVAVLLADGTLRLWGHDGWGQIGVGTNGFYYKVPKTPKVTGVAAVFATGYMTFALKPDGSLLWWGASLAERRNLELGRNHFVPTPLTLP